MSKWYGVNCRQCGGEIRVHEDWSNVPEYHKECAWDEESCEICHGSMRIHGEGIFSFRRVAVAYNPKTGENISKTRDGSEGTLFQGRIADTYEAETERMTHRTKMVEKNVIFPNTSRRPLRIGDDVFRRELSNRDKQIHPDADA